MTQSRQSRAGSESNLNLLWRFVLPCDLQYPQQYSQKTAEVQEHERLHRKLAQACVILQK